ncbi:HAMP domain-containing histidine kinase [Lactonifactor longoviformis]|uniref:histidine kinase n=1 Tax=Lactonifactor longoviformis DSM 17459 TaxID=1122155 RepID=A0A1M5AIY0_9CLOT|nr:HAMP domain-containing sensor histidine kinase [Lactonifactor longoviformis]POP33238.1 HAMP domain-containing histidine kinase [Lactonifactor longoviformis]SHF30231.1 Signal transduction histidine kinase [Lactonifactor longoviformis DSM 17459]
MRLSKKTFLYSIMISLVLVLFVLLYFIFMLPSLYVEYAGQEYLESIIQVQEGYSKNRSYEGLEVRNPTGSATLEIPLEGDSIYLAGKAFRLTINIKEPKLLEAVEQLRDSVENSDSFADLEIPDIDFEELKESMRMEDGGPLSDLLSVQIDADEELQDIQTRKGKVHIVSDTMVVFEGGMNDKDNDYTTYIAAGKTKDAVIFSFLPVMTPQMNEIRPIVFGSLPMIAAVLFLLVLIASQIFSKKIVNPIIRLAGYAEDVKEAGYREMAPLEIHEKDEIGELGTILNELYEKLRLQYQELEAKNRSLARENKRQEVFLRASSHQLKTPITAALLLTEGMISEIGKYKDTGKYLPEVKRQLLSMRKIVEDILYLNHSADNIKREPVNMNLLLKEVLESYRIPAGEKKLTFRCEEQPVQAETDGEIMRKILDNLVSNAVSYTPPKGEITIRLTEDSFEIYNAGAHIEEELLPHIYEPFVSSDTSRKGRGLGLYVISYYMELLGFQIEISNEENGVLARMYLSKKEHKNP